MMYLFSRPTREISRRARPVRAVRPTGRRRTRCFATSTIRERVENACFLQFYFITSRRVLSSPCVFERPRETCTSPASSKLQPVPVRRRFFDSQDRSQKLLFREHFIVFQDRAAHALVRCRRSIRDLFCVAITRGAMCVQKRRTGMAEQQNTFHV